MQGASPYIQPYSHLMQDTSPPSQGTSSHTLSFNPMYQGTSHPPSLPPTRTRLSRQTHGGNFPSISDDVQRTIKFHNRQGRFLQTRATSLTTNFQNRDNNTGKTNLESSLVITASLTTKRVYSPSASLVTSCFKGTHTAVYPSANSGIFKGYPRTITLLISGVATLLLHGYCSSRSHDHGGEAIATGGFTSPVFHHDSRLHALWLNGFLDDRGVG